jgi:hypothetical protein
MVFNATSRNISVTSLRSALLAKEAGLLAENHRPAASQYVNIIQTRGRCVRDRIVVGLTTTSAISAYHH